MKNDWNPTVNPAGSPSIEPIQENEFVRFENALRKVLSVSKSDVDERIKEQKKDRMRDNKRG